MHVSPTIKEPADIISFHSLVNRGESVEEDTSGDHSVVLIEKADCFIRREVLEIIVLPHRQLSLLCTKRVSHANLLLLLIFVKKASGHKVQQAPGPSVDSAAGYGPTIKTFGE